MKLLVHNASWACPQSALEPDEQDLKTKRQVTTMQTHTAPAKPSLAVRGPYHAGQATHLVHERAGVDDAQAVRLASLHCHVIPRATCTGCGTWSDKRLGMLHMRNVIKQARTVLKLLCTNSTFGTTA